MRQHHFPTIWEIRIIISRGGEQLRSDVEIFRNWSAAKQTAA